MLNYIWAGLIVCSLVFAMIRDVGDISHDTFRNGKTLPVTIKLDSPPDPAKPAKANQPVHVIIDPAVYKSFYGVDAAPPAPYAATLVTAKKGAEIRFSADSTFPPPLNVVKDTLTSDDDKELHAIVAEQKPVDEMTIEGHVTFDTVRFATAQAVTKAAIAAAKTAVTLALGLIGVIAMWLGLTRIGEKAGLIAIFNRMVRPVLRPLFPEVPPDHPAMGFMALNLTANILGMGNAATPMGLKAMEELQTLNPKKDTATNSMVMLLAMHASSIQLLPPVLVIAVMGLRATNELLLPIWIVSAFGLTMGIIAAKVFGLMPGYQKSDPNRVAAEEAAAAAAAAAEVRK
jgi:spore maturation protein A